MLRFITIFVAVLSALFVLEMLQPVQLQVVQPFTGLLAELCALLIAPFDDEVLHYGRVLQHQGSNFAVSIEAGCNGVEATIVLIAAVVAFPGAWRHRLVAIILGFFAIQIMNIARIISLFYLGQWNLDIFSWTHLYLWPVLIMLDVMVVFLLYLRFLGRSATAQAVVA